MKVGGVADVVVEAKTKAQLIEVLKVIRKLKLNYFVIAGGSNLVFSDQGFRGVIVHNLADQIKVDKRQVVVDAGCRLQKLVRDLANKNLGGIDFLANIPGSVGGGVVGNAGCYGKGIGEYVISAMVFDMKTGKEKVLLPKQLKFSYRNSLCKAKPNWIVTEVKMKVSPVKKSVVLKAIEAERMERWHKHPHQPSAGSFFKNPSGIAVWKLIDAAGWRGKKTGGAQISTKHPNFIINTGGATAKDIKQLARMVQAQVKRDSKVTLETEVRMVDEKGVVS